uniref:Uncharacterized protein n=1 Tax=Anguilla anguilla TaxID=7936 RepID=A0A0E9WQT4_ANGAN
MLFYSSSPCKKSAHYIWNNINIILIINTSKHLVFLPYLAKEFLLLKKYFKTSVRSNFDRISGFSRYYLMFNIFLKIAPNIFGTNR